MLVKLNIRDLADDFGILVKGPESYVHLYENGPVRISAKTRLYPVIKVKARWVDRDVRVDCEIADTEEKKIRGLQAHTHLEENHGMFFPYAGPTDVTFHQGTVPFSLDLLFLREGSVIKIQRNTQVGSTDRWSCRDCDGIIEVSSGFCASRGISRGDRVVLFAYSQDDLDSYEADRVAIQAEEAMLANEQISSLARALVGMDHG